MQTLTLAEYATIPGVQLTHEQCGQLRRVSDGAIGVTPSMDRPGSYDLTASAMVGAVTVGDLRVVIQPKLPMARILFLLAYGLRLFSWGGAFDFKEAEDLPEAIVEPFARVLERALARGLLQTYRSEDDALPIVRGRWRVEDQVRRRFGIAPPAEITYDDYTVDNVFNRILLAAARCLQRLRLRSPASRSRLRRLAGRFEGVADIRFDPRRLPPVGFNRLTAHYEPAVLFSSLVIKATSFDLRQGGVSAAAFLIDMNRVFEDFIVVGMREALSLSPAQLVQGSRGHAMYLDDERRIHLQPDLTIWKFGRPCWIADAKYKRVATDTFPNGDIYQALAYGAASGLSEVTLIYPTGEAAPAAYYVGSVQKWVRVELVDLSGSPAEILASLRHVADRARSSWEALPGGWREGAIPTGAELSPVLTGD